nr:peptide chain release factor N(5)-glutamine methyltransferase [Haliea sp. SAOS-164]
MSTVRELLGRAAQMPGEDPRRDAEVLLCHCLDKPRSWLYTWPDAEVADDVHQQFAVLLERRAQGEPVAHLTGSRGFWSLELAVESSTLIPRPETETLVEWALELPLPDSAAVLDLGTGTGAIALALASERPAWQVTGVDAEPAAIELARRNARRCGLAQVVFELSDWFAALGDARYHLVVGNPPYIAPDDPHLQRGDLRFEPHSALVAAADGLADLKHIVATARGHLQPGGWLLLEHGYEQGAAVRELFSEAGYAEVQTRHDLGGRERITGGQYAQ